MEGGVPGEGGFKGEAVRRDVYELVVIFFFYYGGGRQNPNPVLIPPPGPPSEQIRMHGAPRAAEGAEDDAPSAQNEYIRVSCKLEHM